MQEEVHSLDNQKSLPGIDLYSLFAFIIFATSLTYTIYFLTTKGEEDGRGIGLELGGGRFSELQEDLLRRITAALEKW